MACTLDEMQTDLWAHCYAESNGDLAEEEYEDPDFEAEVERLMAGTSDLSDVVAEEKYE